MEEVVNKGSKQGGAAALEPGEQDFFKRLDEDAAAAEEDAKAEANVMHGFSSHRSAVVLWLRQMGIADHI